MATALGTITIDQLWAQLKNLGYCKPDALDLPAGNALGSAGIDALLQDATLFPRKALTMAVASTQPPGESIVLTGTITGTFLGQPNPAAIATFTIDGNGQPALTVAVTTAPGAVLGTAFPDLREDSAAAVQAFSAATFTARSGAPGVVLQFTGTLDLTATEYAHLWAGKMPALAGAITCWTAKPAFTLTTGYADASASAGTLGLQLQVWLEASGDQGASAGQIQGRIVSAGTALDGLDVCVDLPAPAGVPLQVETLPTDPPRSLPDLSALAGLFLGRELAALIPSQLSLGSTLFLDGLQLTLTRGASGLQAVQLWISTGHDLRWPLLPGDLVELNEITAVFAWFGGRDVDVTFGGDFELGGNDKLRFTATFSLRDRVLTAYNDGAFDVGDLLSIVKIPPLHTGLTVEELKGTLSIPDKTWSFDGDVTIADEWSVTLHGTTLVALTEVHLTLARTSAAMTAAISASATLFGATFQVTATTDPSAKGWTLGGRLVAPLKLATVAKDLLPFDVNLKDDVDIVKLSVTFDTAGDSFSFDTEVDWTIGELDTKVSAELQIHKAAKQYTGFLKGEIDIHGLVLDVRYDFTPKTTDITFAYRNLTIEYEKGAKGEATVTIHLGSGTVGDLFDFLLSFADPGRSLSLGAPWDAFEKIELPDITITVNLKTKSVRVELDHVADLGFLSVTKIVLDYRRDYGTPRFDLQISGSFLGVPYGDKSGQPPLKWDALNEPPPAVPGTGTKVFDLEFLGVGQRVAVSGSVPTEMDKVVDALEAAMRPPADPNKNPIVQSGSLVYDAASGWLIATRFTVMSTLRMDVVFNDPNLYGLLIELSGDKAGLFAGLRFEILYRKVTDTIGVYHIELTLPDEMRHLEFGEVSITLPIVVIDIYTNGNFRVDFGFPPSLTDFSRSFSVQVFPFTGFAGFYFAVLDGETSTKMPQVTSGLFGTVLEFGFALQVGVGKTLSLGILTGGISITVGGMLQGVLAWYTPNDSNLPAVQYHHLTGTAALVGEVYATVDFGILQASVSLTVFMSISLDLESYKAILIEASAGVRVSVSIKILFISIQFSFSATITERFQIGSDTSPPWQLAAPGGGGGAGASMAQVRNRRSYRRLGLPVRQPRHALLRARPARPLRSDGVQLRTATVSALNVETLVVPLTSQALSQDFDFPGGPQVPAGTTTPVLALLLGLRTSTKLGDGANPLLAFLLGWAVDALGHEHDTVSAAVIDEILETLSDPAACDTYFSYGALTALFTQKVVFVPTPRPTTDDDGASIAVLAMIPELTAATPDFSIDFSTDRQVDADYEAMVRAYFAKLAASFARQNARPGSSVKESLATFLFRYQFSLLTKAVVQGAREVLAATTLTITADAAAPTSLAAIANVYNNDYTVRPNDTWDAMATMFGIPAPALAAANPDLPAGGPATGDTVFIPAQRVSYVSQLNDTLAALAACFGLDQEALQTANSNVVFSPLASGTTLAIPATRLLHTVVAGETAASIATAFVVDRAGLAAANPDVDLDKLTTNQVLLIPRQLTPLAVAAANQGTAGLLDTDTTIAVAGVNHQLTPADTLGGLAQSYDLSLEQLVAQIAKVPKLFAPGTISIMAIPGMRFDMLTERLATTNGFTNALSLTSRFLMGGLRVPAPCFDPKHPPNAHTAYPLYALVGQEFPVNPNPPQSYAITLTATSAPWVSIPNGALTIPLDSAETGLISNFAKLTFTPDVTADASRPLTPFTVVVDRQAPAAVQWWQTADLPALAPLQAGSPLAVTAAHPSLWMMPAPLVDALVASPTGVLAYAGCVGTTAADGSTSATPLAASRFATVVDLTVEHVPGSVPGVYNVVGTDQAGLQRLLAVLDDLTPKQQAGVQQQATVPPGTADIYVAHASQEAGAPTGTLVSDAFDRTNSFLLKTNLSAATNAPLALPSLEAQLLPLDTPPPAPPVATFAETDGVDFLQLLCECSAVRSGGFYLRYIDTSGRAGLPKSLFNDGTSAKIKLIVVSSHQAANGCVARAFNNALIVGDNVDPAHDRLFFEAVSYCVVAGDTLTSIALAMGQQYPELPDPFDWSTLAAVNQLIPGTLIPGTPFAGTTATADDSLLSLALRAQQTVADLATAIQGQSCLRSGARLQLVGEPIQTIADGDTLVSIAQEHAYLDPASLAALNASTPNLLAVGQTLTVPGHPDHTIQDGDTFGAIARAAGLPVTVLGDVNATAAILAANAGMVVAADTLRTAATLPPGHVCFCLQLEPDRVTTAGTPGDSADAERLAHELFHMLGFEIADGPSFDASDAGLPAMPVSDEKVRDGVWNYRQLLSVYPFAKVPSPAMPAALPLAANDPYQGIGPGAQVSLQLSLQDVLGNRTLGSTLLGTNGGPAVTAPVGYTDDLISPAGWPSLLASYRFVPDPSNLRISFTLAPDKFLPDASPAPMVAGAPDPTRSAAATRAAKAQERYAQIHYQLLQADVECALTTSLGPVADPAARAGDALSTLRGVVASAYVFSGAAGGLHLTVAGAPGFTNLTELTNTFATVAGNGYSVLAEDLANVNANASAALIFGAGASINVPAFERTRANETPAAFTQQMKVSDIAAFADRNADVPVTAGVVVATVSRAIPADHVGLSLAAMADAVRCSVADGTDKAIGLATANATATLVKGLTFTSGTASFVTGPTDTLQTVASALSKTGPSVTPVDLAMANLLVAPFFAAPPAQPLTVANAVTVAGDTLATLAATFPTVPGDHSPAARILQDNLEVAGLWPASTALYVGDETVTLVPDDTLASLAVAHNTSPGMILTRNVTTPFAASAALVIPYSADSATIAAATYAAAESEQLSAIVARFDGWSLPDLVQDHLNWPGLFAATPITSNSGNTTTPTASSTFAALAIALDVSLDQLVASVAGRTDVVRAGAVFVTPPMKARAGETVGALAQRYGADPGTLAAANASLPKLLASGETFAIDGTQITVGANDTFGQIAARVNADRAAKKLSPLSVAAIGTAASAVHVLGRTILGPLPPATIAGAVTAAAGRPIVSLAVDLAISRDPARVRAGFDRAPRVISANAPIMAAPFAAGGGDVRSLRQFATDFEAAFPGRKLATGPRHTQCSPVLSKPSLRAVAGGGGGATPSAAVRALWVVDLSPTGITYQIEHTKPRFFAFGPLSTTLFSADAVAVPTYKEGSGLGDPTTMNVRGADPEQWNLAFLQAVDLALSPSYAPAAQTDPDIATSLATIISAKADIAAGLATLVAPLEADVTTGLQDATDAMTQQLLIELSRAYTVQSLVQFDVAVAGAGASDANPPRLAGKIKVRALTTPSDETRVDPNDPFAALAAVAQVARGYLADAIADVPNLVRPEVDTTFKGTQHYTTAADDTVATIARHFSVVPNQLPGNLTIASSGSALFRGSVPINVATVIVPEQLQTLSAAADWLPTTVADLLTANAERTDFFAPGRVVTVDTTSYTPQPADTLADVAAKFGGLSAFAAGLAEVDVGSLDGAYVLNAAPPRALSPVPNVSFQSTKVTLGSGATLTSMLTVGQPTAQRQLVLDLDFVPYQLEFDVHRIANVSGYEGSSWLSFVVPLDRAPNAIGQVGIPLALRGYPVPAVVSGQQALHPPDADGIDRDSTLTQWDYQFSVKRSFAAQDEMTLEIAFKDALAPVPTGTGSVDRSKVIAALAGFNAIWGAVAKDLVAVPKLLGNPLPSDRSAAKAALAALANAAATIQSAWKGLAQRMVELDDESTSVRYQLSTLSGADGKVDALVLERDGQANDFSVDPDAFMFLADPSFAQQLAQKTIPPGLKAVFIAHGFALSNHTSLHQSQAGGDWMLIDDGDPSDRTTPIPPQTYRLRLPNETGASLQVWRQFLWPALTLNAGSGGVMVESKPVQLSCTQAATRLTYPLQPDQEIAEGAPLDLQFRFYRLDAMTLSNAWGGFSISRNANLLANVNQHLVYQTPLTRFPTRMTPFIERLDPVALEGSSLEEALSALFQKLFAGKAATDSSATCNVRVQGGYWQSPSGANPVTDPLRFRNPLSLVPIRGFDVASDWRTGGNSFCHQLATAMHNAAAGMGIVPTAPGCWVVDLMVYGDETNDAQPLLRIGNHYLPVPASEAAAAVA